MSERTLRPYAKVIKDIAQGAALYQFRRMIDYSSVVAENEVPPAFQAAQMGAVWRFVEACKFGTGGALGTLEDCFSMEEMRASAYGVRWSDIKEQISALVETANRDYDALVEAEKS